MHLDCLGHGLTPGFTRPTRLFHPASQHGCRDIYIYVEVKLCSMHDAHVHHCVYIPAGMLVLRGEREKDKGRE